MQKKRNKHKKRQVASGIVHIQASFNNTIVTITDLQGDTVAAASAGKLGFKGSRRSTPYAAQLTANDAAEIAKNMGMKTVSVRVKGPGSGRDSAVKAVHSAGLTVTAIRDVTPDCSQWLPTKEAQKSLIEIYYKVNSGIVG
jgi:small subunit ribosomal protein S11